MEIYAKEQARDQKLDESLARLRLEEAKNNQGVEEKTTLQGELEKLAKERRKIDEMIARLEEQENKISEVKKIELVHTLLLFFIKIW